MMCQIKKTLLVLSAILTGTAGAYAEVPRFTNENWISMNDTHIPYQKVCAIERYKGKLYIGGSFTKIGSGNASHFAVRDADSWIPVGNSDSIRGSDAVVYAIAFDSSENLYIGGSFNGVGMVSTKNIAVWNNISWDSLQNTLSEQIHTIAYNPFTDRLYAAGNMHIVQELFVKKYNLTIWEWGDKVWDIFKTRYIGEWNDYSTEYCTYTGQILQIGFTNTGKLVAAGFTSEFMGKYGFETFTFDSSGAFYAVAVGVDSYYSGKTYYNEYLLTVTGDSVQKETALQVGTYLQEDQLTKKAMVVDKKGNIYLGGKFSIPCSTGYARNIVMFDGKKFNSIGNGVDGTVYALALSDDDSLLYVGGDFDNAGGISSPMIAAVDLKKIPDPVTIVNRKTHGIGYKSLHSSILISDVLPTDMVEIYNLSGQLLLQSTGLSHIDSEKMVSQAVTVRILRKKQVVYTRRLLMQMF